MVGLGVAFGVFIGKELFGGTGRNLFNPALVGRCFLALAYAKPMSESYMKPSYDLLGCLLFKWLPARSVVDAVTVATPLSAAKGGNIGKTAHLFLGSVEGSVGETSAILIILGGVFLLLTRVANWRTVVSILGSFIVLTSAMLISGVVSYERMPGVFYPVVWHLFAGGLLFGTFFMATDPVTSPTTNSGKWLYGILIGSVTVLIRHFTGYVEGVTFAILLGNITAPILDEIVFKFRLRRLASEG
jgi:Na+-translocating ferredoxin:NAD+ oxidoreductase RnfD subunit